MKEAITGLKNFINLIAGIVGVAGVVVFYIAIWAIMLGDLYWLYLSFKFGNFFMFFVGVFLAPFTGIVGAWSFIFGVPDWVISWFG